MNIKAHWLFALAIVQATLCLLGYMSLDWTHLNVRFLVVLYWLAIIGSLISFVNVRRKRLIPITAILTPMVSIRVCINLVSIMAQWFCAMKGHTKKET